MGLPSLVILPLEGELEGVIPLPEVESGFTF